MRAAVTSPSTLTNPAQARARLQTAQVELLDLRQAVARLDRINRELVEWRRIAAERAERIVALEQRGASAQAA